MRSAAIEHYSIYLFTGLLPWVWTTSALHEGTSSISSSGHLITKSLFPAHILPVVAVLTNLINFLLSLPLLVLFMVFSGLSIPWSWVMLPWIVTVQFLFLSGLTLGLSALNVHYRDVQHLIGNILTFLFFLCPIVYAASVVPEHLQYTLLINPFALITVCYHKILLDGALPVKELAVLSGVAIVCLFIGEWMYRQSFAESL